MQRSDPSLDRARDYAALLLASPAGVLQDIGNATFTMSDFAAATRPARAAAASVALLALVALVWSGRIGFAAAREQQLEAEEGVRG